MNQSSLSFCGVVVNIVRVIIESIDWVYNYFVNLLAMLQCIVLNSCMEVHMGTISYKDKAILQDLAKQQMEYAKTPKNIEREKRWQLHNDLQGIGPLVTIEEGTFFHEVARPLTCETEIGRAFESQIINAIIGREDMDDDRATPDYFSVARPSWFTPFGVDVHARGAKGSIGYEFIHPIRDLEADMHILGPSTWGYEKHSPNLELAQDVFFGIMPVIETSGYPSIGLSYVLVKLMSMETMFTSIFDYPELFHQIMRQLTNDWLTYQRELEDNGILITNNRNQGIGQGTTSITSGLVYEDGTKTKNMWGYFDSQETSGMSPDMFKEMFFPYYKQLMDSCGLVNYGCCEPVDGIWDNCLSQCNNLRKLSIAPWCNEEMMADRLRGTNIIYHRKPSPNLLGETGIFNEAEYTKHITATLKAAKGCHLEFSLRDVYSLGGDKKRGKRVVELIWDLIERHWSE